MRNKIQNSFHELPTDSHSSLRDSLLMHIAQITPQTERVIVTQLCLALSDLVLLMPSWQNPILNLIDQLSQSPTSIWPLLEILTLIPEEINSRYLRLGSNRREELLQQLEGDSATVLEFLCSCLMGPAAAATTNTTSPDNGRIAGGTGSNNQGSHNLINSNNNNNNNEIATNNAQNMNGGRGTLGTNGTFVHDDLVQSRVLKCFTSWVQIQAMYVSDVTYNLVVQLAFSILANENQSANDPLKLHDHAAESVCVLLQTLESLNNNDSQTLEMQLFAGVMNLEKAFMVAVSHENVDAIMNYCRVFTVLAESFLERMVVVGPDGSCGHYSIKCLELVLKCVGYYDYEVARITFNLWYRLSEILYMRDNDALSSLFKPHIEHLIGELLRHSQMDADREGLIEENEDLFVSTRKDMIVIGDINRA